MKRVSGGSAIFAISVLAAGFPAGSARACFAGPDARPTQSSTELPVAERVSPSVVISSQAYSFYISSDVMASVLADEEYASFWPAEIIAAVEGQLPLAADLQIPDPADAAVTDEEQRPESLMSLELMDVLSYLIDRSQVAIHRDGVPVGTITRIDFDDVCSGGRSYRINGELLARFTDWIS